MNGLAKARGEFVLKLANKLFAERHDDDVDDEHKDLNDAASSIHMDSRG